MLSKLRSTLVCVMALLSIAATAQTTINVGPGQTYTTIQSGINAAANGDTVLVAPGTYNENVYFNGKAIIVTSSGGPAVTTISGPNKTASVIFMQGETRSSVLSNFTITVGGQYYLNLMGGIYLYQSSPTILNNIITNTTCYGINAQYSSPLIQGNEISYVQSQPYECSFASGAGIWLFSQLNGIAPVVVGNTIENNTESGLEDAGGNGGGGIAVWSSAPIIQSNVIRNNATGKYFSPGGGGEGGGIFFEGPAEGLIANNLIYGNTSNLDGGGISFSGFLEGASHLTFANNTITDNAVVPVSTYSQQVYGGEQLYFGAGESSADTFINNIISGSTTDASIVCYDDPNAPTTYINNDFYNAAGPVTSAPSSGTCSFPIGTGGNISANPLFAAAAAANYQLQRTSPGVDKGSNTALQLVTPYGVSLSTDVGGDPRVQDTLGNGCIIDMGAYEYPGTSNTCSTSETLQSSLNPSAYGQSVTFTAQLSSPSGVPTGDVQFSDGSTVLGTEAISGAGSSTFSTAALNVGKHPITAAYQPSGSFPAASASLTQVVNGTPTSTTLSCSAAPLYIDATTLLTAMVTSTSGTPTGSITFTDGATTLGRVALTGGDASLTYLAQLVGSHTITATYAPTGAFAPGSATCTLTVLALPTTSVLTVTPTTTAFGSPVTLTATVSPVTEPGPSVPTGSVTFYNSGAALNTANLSGGIATLTTSALPGGADSLTCTYSGSSIYAPSNCNTVAATITASPSTLTLTSSANPSPALTPITFTARLSAGSQSAPAGNTIVLTLNGQTLTLTTDATGSASTTTPGLIPNTYAVTASFGGSPSLQASSAALSQKVNPNPTTTTLAASPNPGQQGQPVTLSATVTATQGTAHPDGSVQFFDGSTALGSTPVAASAGTSSTAVFSATTLAAGPHTLSAVYTPATTSFLPSQSTLQPFTVAFQGFTFTAAHNPLTIETRLTGTDVLTLTSLGGFTAPIAVSCPATLPAAVTCTLSSRTVQLPSNGTATTTLTLNTQITTGATFWTQLQSRPSSKTRTVLASLLPLTLLTLTGLRRRRRQLSLLRNALLLACLALVSSTLSACAPGQTVSTFPGTYALTLTASGTPQGSSTPTTHTLDLTLIVTPYQR